MLIMLSLVITMDSCTKNEEVSYKDLLTAETWNGVYTKRYDSNGNLLETISLSGVTLDFYDDGTVKLKNQGITMHSGQWELLDDDSKIHFDWGIAGDEIYDIRKLTDDEFVYANDNEETRYER